VARADDFVQRLPDGARTSLGEGGLSLSGGQRQRIALARAVIGAPRLMIADDPLSALDIHTAALVEAALREVARCYDPAGGRILLDGIDLRKLAAAELRRSVVMVPQEAFLFSGTVAGNITIGRPGAAPRDIERAARATGAHDFITALPDGYDTDVRRRGGRLSAGQRPLISLARAFLAGPSVVILDEATSALDIPAERAVQQAMRTVLRGRTALVIAHRLSTVQIADRVLVMAGGRIVEDGTQADLMPRQGQFARLHRAWLGSNSPAPAGKRTGS
jgi:ATP-binding cassette, subfamily B, bacterial